MNRSHAIPLLIAVLALSALAIAATTLETTVTTDPDDEINPDWDRLPLSENDASAIQGEMTAGDDNPEAHSSGAQSTASSGGGGDGTGTASGLVTPPEETSFDRLIALLITLLQIGVGLAVLAGVVGGLIRYQDSIADVFGFDDTPESPPPTAEPAVWPPSEPTSVVEAAWIELVSQLSPAQPETTTPAECLVLARRQDLDMRAVTDITTAFERVQYGGHAVDAERSRAKQGLATLTGANR